MQRFFTKLFLLVLISFVGSSIWAQRPINALIVNSPEGLKGAYPVVRAAFGSTSNAEITANCGFADDGVPENTNGCETLVNNLTGLIGFVDRGSCEFGVKSFNTEAAGAIAVIVCNDRAGGAVVMPGGTKGGDVTVPTFMMSLEDCQKLRADITAGGVNATLGFFCQNTSNYGPEVVWGHIPGQGDFKNGLNDWTVDTENTWEWNETGAIRKGAYGGVQMASFSHCDGVMEYNSDWLDNGGVTGEFGAGVNPTPNQGALISPVIDLSGQDIKGIVIEFTQALRQFQSRYYVIASKDGGQTWSDTVRINTEYPVNSNAVAGERRRVAFLGYEGVQQLRIQFFNEANYYYWGIDDVVVVNESKPDITIDDIFYSGAPSLRIPKDQVDRFPIIADIYNRGNGTAEGVSLNVSITSGNEVLASYDKTLGSMAAGTSFIDQIVTESFTPPSEVGIYNIVYTVSSSEGTEPESKTKSTFFEVTDKTFGNLLPEADVTPANYMSYSLSPWILGGEVFYYTAANVYRVTNGEGKTVKSVRFGFNNPVSNIAESGFVSVELYEYVDEDGSNECGPFERTLVGKNTIFLDPSEQPDFRNITVPIWAVDGDGNPMENIEIRLKNNTNYVIAANTEPLDPTVPRYEFLGYTGRTGNSFDRSSNYFAINVAFDSTDLADRVAGSLFGVSGASVDDVNERSFEIISNGALRTAVYLEMDIDILSSSTYDIATSGKVNVFPIPANNDIYFDLELEKVSNEVRIDLIGLDGKLVTSQKFNNVKDDRVKMDISLLPSGSYTALINTAQGVITKKVIVTK